MDQVSLVLKEFTNLMDQNIRGVQISCYSVALVGFTIALRKVKPFTKFKKPSDIPNNFIKERRELSGIVKRIDPNGSVLMIQHKPLIDIPLISEGQLPVKISGVNVTGLGLNWLQAIVAGNEVKFIPVAKEKDFVECEVLLLQSGKQKGQNAINIGENLVRIGFGLTESIEKPLIENPNFLSYYKRLQHAQQYAIRKELGLRYYAQSTTKVLLSLAKTLNRLLIRAAKQVPKLPDRVHKAYIA